MWNATRELSVFAPIVKERELRKRLAAIEAALDKHVAATEEFAPALVPDTDVGVGVTFPPAELSAPGG